MILVTGATGNAGGAVVARLAATGVGVRALVRDPATAALPDGVEVVRGDLADPGGLDAALAGVDAVFLAWPFHSAERGPDVLDVIARNARRIVYLSSSGVNGDTAEQNDPVNQLHSDMERLIDATGLPRTFLRADTFATNALAWAAQIRRNDEVRGLASNKAVVHEHDIAAVAARVLTDDAHVGAAYVITGPRVVTKAEQVHAIGAALGRPLRFEELAPEEAGPRMLAAGLPPVIVETLVLGARGLTPSPVTSTVEELTGTSARSFEQWAFDHVQDFR